MRRGRKMLLNTILLTATALVMRSVGMAFQVYLSKKIGASGIGLFQLIMSVSMLAATFSISGSRFATTRLISEELGKGRNDGVKAALRRCLAYAFCFGTAAALLLYFGAEQIGTVWIGDARTVLSLKLLALSLPAFSTSSVLSGYFTAVTRVAKSAAVSIIEQLIRIAVVVAALSLSPGYTLERACAVIVAGGVAGEFASFFLLFILYLFDKRRYVPDHKKPNDITKRLLGIALPLALSAYARTALSTLENLLIPRGFKKSGASTEKALADYGMIQGMVFPVIAFPSAFFYALAELIVPELTEAQVNGRTREIREIVSRILYLCILFSLGVTAAIFAFSGELGLSVYNSRAVGRFIRLLALLMPVIFMDSVTDGMLRGLGQQMHSMAYNIVDSAISVILVWFLLPQFAVTGYIIMIYFTDIFNFTLSLRRLRIVTKFTLSPGNIIKAALCAAGSVNIAVLFLRFVGLPLSAGATVLTAHIALSLAVYVPLLVLLRCVGPTDIRWLHAMMGMRPEM